MERKQFNQVSIRLVKDVPLITEEQLDTPEKASKVVGDFIRNMDREMLCVVNFNSKLQPINFNVVSIGTVNQSLAVPRDILKSAILSNASNIMVLHNHPSGILSPSKDDIVTTARIIGACDMIGIPLLDHIIVGPKREEYFSMKVKDTIKFNKSVKYQANLEYLNFKEPNLNRVEEKNNKLGKIRGIRALPNKNAFVATNAYLAIYKSTTHRPEI